jgi:YHS domain-containing protein
LRRWVLRSRTIWAVLVVLAVALVCMPGCQKKQAPATETPATTETATTDTTQVAMTCPVCGTAVAEGGQFTAEYEGKTYEFCCAECRDKFTTSPTTYVKPVEAAPATQ